MFYDCARGQEIDYAYDLEVTCTDCQTLYLNGSVPGTGPHQRLALTKPVGLMLFAGNYPAQSAGANWLLNSTLTPSQAATFGLFVARGAAIHEKHLGMPYRQALAFFESHARGTVQRLAVCHVPNHCQRGLEPGF